jgi:hypothetical protein
MAKVVPIKQIIEEAEDAEEEQNISVAKEDYEEAIKQNPLAEKAYDRLMILLRKEKDYKGELKLINAGIKAFESFYRSRKSRSKKIAEVSEKLNKAFGFTDKKGNALYDPEPIAKWKKRRVTVLKKIK